MTKEDILNQINIGKKAYYRGGNMLRNALVKSTGFVSKEDALCIFNTYGIKPRELKILFYSHGLQMDDEGFSSLLHEQEDGYKRRHPCSEINDSDQEILQIPALPFPCGLDDKVMQDYDEDGPIGKPYSYNDYIKKIESISGVSEELMGSCND